MTDRLAAHRPCVTVLSPNAVDAVRCAGGLICDRVRLGWRVTVLVPADEDTRSLRILGADVADIDAPPDGLRDRRSALVASGALYANDREARSEIDSALATKTIEVLVWGAAMPAELDRGAKVVSYRLSGAARAFKTHALIAAGLPANDVATETFRTKCAPELIARELDVAG
jgi:hypothetical protein